MFVWLASLANKDLGNSPLVKVSRIYHFKAQFWTKNSCLGLKLLRYGMWIVSKLKHGRFNNPVLMSGEDTVAMSNARFKI